MNSEHPFPPDDEILAGEEPIEGDVAISDALSSLPFPYEPCEFSVPEGVKVTERELSISVK